MLNAKEIAMTAARALDDKKGKEIKVIKIDKLTTIAEYFVICTGSSNTQINALCDNVEKALTQTGDTPAEESPDLPAPEEPEEPAEPGGGEFEIPDWLTNMD